MPGATHLTPGGMAFHVLNHGGARCLADASGFQRIAEAHVLHRDFWWRRLACAAQARRLHHKIGKPGHRPVASHYDVKTQSVV